jgi:cholesterol transport system auxiliary component
MMFQRPSRRAFSTLLSSAALAALAGACTSSAVPNYDLSAPRPGRASGGGIGQVAVAEPAAVQPLETERIIVKDASGAVSSVGGGQWADRLPRLIQSRLIQTFDNASTIKASRPGERVTPDYQLNTEIRAFHISAPASEAVVEMAVKLVDDRSGRIVGSRIVRRGAPVGAIDAANAAQALDRALSGVLVDIVRWVGGARVVNPGDA